MAKFKKSDTEVAAKISYSTVRAKATVTHQKSGAAIVNDEVIPGKGGNFQFKSTHFQKFVDGSVVECVFRANFTSGDMQLISVNAIDPDARYQIFLQDIAESELATSDIFVAAVDYLASALGYTDDVIERLHKELADWEVKANGRSSPDESLPIVAITPPLEYDQAHQIIVGLNNAVPEMLTAQHRAKRDGFLSTVTIGKAADRKSGNSKSRMLPEWIAGNTHWLSNREQKYFGAAANVMDRGGHINILLKGPSGYGKTTKLMAVAQELGLEVAMMDCSKILDTESWFGYQEAIEGSTVFVETEFTEKVRRGGCLVILDEMNRIEPQISNSLFPLLDTRRQTTVHGHDITVGPSVIFGFTVNLGIKYAGTYVIDAALLNRGTLAMKVGPAPQRVEFQMLRNFIPDAAWLSDMDINTILAVVTDMRKVVDRNNIDVDVSTRSSLKLAELMAAGLSIEDAVQGAIIEFAQDEDQKPLQDSLQIVIKGSRP